MEDFLQFAVFLLFIIISIASSIKKKNKNQTFTKTKIDASKRNYRANSVSTQQKSGSKILEDILGFKFELPEPQKPEVPTYSPKQIKLPKYSEHDFETEYEKINEDGVSDYYEKEIAEKTELISEKVKHQVFKSKSNFENNEKLRHKIHTLISDKSNLNNYIIIQEILNKPKALRR
jgi:hypothetical protein